MPIPGFEGGKQASAEIRPVANTAKNTSTAKSRAGYVPPITVDFKNDFGEKSEDFIEYYVYDMDGNFIGSEIREGGVSGDKVNLNPGEDIRALGLIAGKYRIVYNFLRQRGGKPRVFFIDSDNDLWNGIVREEDGKWFKGAELDLTNPTTREEVFVFDDNYLIQDISTSRTEVRVIPKSSEIGEYKNGFASLQFKEMQYDPVLTDITGDISVDSTDSTKLVANLDDSDNGFNDNMIGGELIIKNAFITGYNTDIIYKQHPNPNWEGPPPENKEEDAKTTAKEEAIKRREDAKTDPLPPESKYGDDPITEIDPNVLSMQDTADATGGGYDPVTNYGDVEGREGDMGGDI
jgi:hypothetical protein|tara:strand:- start:6747 stop:7790 length:1044 start_codon:yes stop_codon:yes gene_type:complete